MNNLVKEINGIRNRISMIEFQDHLSYDDYRKESEYKRQIEDLKKQLIGYSGVAVKCTYKDKEHYSSRPSYITDDPSLCWCSEPTLFDNKEEAEKHFHEAEIQEWQYDVEFVNMKYTEKGLEEC